MPTSFAWPAPPGPPLPFDASPASTTTSSALTPEPSIWKLQRMHLPRSGMPWRSHFGGFGGGLGPGSRPMTAIRFASFGQVNSPLYVYAPFASPGWSPSVFRSLHLGSCVGCARAVGSSYRPGMMTTRSLLPDAFTAGWIWRYRQRLKSFVLIAISRLPAFLEKERWSLGRM